MRRYRAPLKLIILSAAFACLSPYTAPAQPPTERDVRVYAGLHAAAAQGDVAEIERLVAAGERVNIQDSRSRTPLHVAAYRKHREAVGALLRLGANPNALDSQRFDVLTIAVTQNDPDMLKLALDGGASPRNRTGPFDGSALMSAAHLGHIDIVRVLIAANAPLDHVNLRGWTALIEAVVLGNGGPNHVAVVRELVNAGADTEIKDRNGYTALRYARQRGYSEMVKILEAAAGRRT
jgi:ankyrin repeat protein